MHKIFKGSYIYGLLHSWTHLKNCGYFLYKIFPKFTLKYSSKVVCIFEHAL